MGTARRVRARRGSPAPSGTLAHDWTENGTTSPVISVGLKSVVLALPLAVLDGAVSPYLDPKAWALHLLVAAVAVVWLLQRSLAEGNLPNGLPADPATRFLRWVVLAYGTWWVVATLASITLGTSVWGNFGRADGLLTRLAAIILYFLVQAQCRSPQAGLSLVDLALLGSVPVVLVALGQAMGWDPLPPVGDPATLQLRVRSTFGQHMFLGSYLVLVIPLAAARLAQGIDRWRESRQPQTPWSLPLLSGGVWVLGGLVIIALGSQWPIVWWGLLPWGVVSAAAWTLWMERNGTTAAGTVPPVLVATLLAGQVFTVIVSGTRAAFLGMLVGLGVTGWALLARRRTWRSLAVGAGGLGAVLVVLLLLNLPGSPLRDLSLKAPPAFARLSSLTELEKGSGRFRVQLWGGILSSWARQLHGEEVIPGVWPRIRSVIGYGPETQLATLGRFTPSRVGSRYLKDRAHNEFLDHLVTGGLVGVGLWLLVIGAVLTIGIRRIRTSGPGLEAGIRVGCLGAILAHLVDAQFGIATPVSRALFWIVAALLTLPPAPDPTPLGRAARPQVGMNARWVAPLVGASILAALVAWGSTRWLMASMAYAQGSRHLSAGKISEAHREFQRASRLVPGLSQPTEAVVGVAFNLAAGERDPARQIILLREAEDMLAQVRRYSSYARTGAYHWVLVGQIALAEFRAGERSKLETALEAYETAARLKPDDSWILANWGMAWLDARNPERARQAAERAVALKPDSWLAWAVLARAASQLGDTTRAQQAAAKARALAPPEGHSLLRELLP